MFTINKSVSLAVLTLLLVGTVSIDAHASGALETAMRNERLKRAEIFAAAEKQAEIDRAQYQNPAQGGDPTRGRSSSLPRPVSSNNPTPVSQYGANSRQNPFDIQAQQRRQQQGGAIGAAAGSGIASLAGVKSAEGRAAISAAGAAAGSLIAGGKNPQAKMAAGAALGAAAGEGISSALKIKDPALKAAVSSGLSALGSELFKGKGNSGGGKTGPAVTPFQEVAGVGGGEGTRSNGGGSGSGPRDSSIVDRTRSVSLNPGSTGGDAAKLASKIPDNEIVVTANKSPLGQDSLGFKFAKTVANVACRGCGDALSMQDGKLQVNQTALAYSAVGAVGRNQIGGPVGEFAGQAAGSMILTAENNRQDRIRTAEMYAAGDAQNKRAMAASATATGD